MSPIVPFLVFGHSCCGPISHKMIVLSYVVALVLDALLFAVSRFVYDIDSNGNKKEERHKFTVLTYIGMTVTWFVPVFNIAAPIASFFMILFK